MSKPLPNSPTGAPMRSPTKTVELTTRGRMDWSGQLKTLLVVHEFRFVATLPAKLGRFAE